MSSISDPESIERQTTGKALDEDDLKGIRIDTGGRVVKRVEKGYYAEDTLPLGHSGNS